jgi:hypothetical protein
MGMKADKRYLQRQGLQEQTGASRVFAGDDVGLAQGLARSWRNVAQVPDGRCDDRQAGVRR